MMASAAVDPPRWQSYVMDHGAGLEDFWQSHLISPGRRVLFVLGRGFDPRMCSGLKMLIRAGAANKIEVLAVDYREGSASPSKHHSADVETNWTELQTLVATGIPLSVTRVEMWSDDGRRIGASRAAAIFSTQSQLVSYTDVVIDISAIPRTIYFPLIAKALYLLDETAPSGAARPNLHVFVSEDPRLDQRIRDEGVEEEADYLHLFRGGLDLEATAQHPKVWLPLLGEGQQAQLERIYDLVKPDEICPVLPSPSLNPRRGDDLVLEYRGLLFDRLRIEPRNFIYASERNPFEVYRQIRKAILHYREALEPLGGCKAVLSALSSKLMSVGALLVAYELKRKMIDVGVAHVESQGYVMSGVSGESGPYSQSELFGLWLSGENYEL